MECGKTLTNKIVKIRDVVPACSNRLEGGSWKFDSGGLLTTRLLKFLLSEPLITLTV
ncbi:hypothetical protein KKF38_03525 [Patescibacteria group bacterium]|nr:hypothetical protein [Patescibacteria group bacterium]